MLNCLMHCIDPMIFMPCGFSFYSVMDQYLSIVSSSIIDVMGIYVVVCEHREKFVFVDFQKRDP